MKSVFNLSIAIVLGLASIHAQADEPIVIKFSHVAAIDTPKGQAAEYFKKQAEALTEGKVKVEIYPNSMLFKDKEELEALQMGSVQMLAPVVGKLGPAGIKEFEAFDLPYLFTDLNAVHRVTKGEIGKSLLTKLDQRGMVGLGYWDAGFRVLSSNKPIHTPDQIKGQKIRINSSKVNQAIISSVGAIPQTMPFSEVYQALQTGVVDGADGNLTNLYTQKQYEVQKHVTLTEHTYSGYVILVNKDFWNKLPEDIRGKLQQAVQEASDLNEKAVVDDDKKALEAIKASGKTEIYTPTPEERDLWVKAMTPVQDQLAERVGKDLVEQIRKTVAAQ
ncbi:MAG: DctP family TRAP transporter solute-binding subunit [Thiothrix sp.]|jgi:C4-dicarboxylate-binding protein DctP|nr:MAG: DctP family TRAP transporter solute-binding subunit [Thiothrix sp.]